MATAASDSATPTFTGPHRPVSLRVANAWGRALRGMGLRAPRLDIPALLRASRIDDAHLDEDDDAPFRERLQALLDDANGAARLNYVGRRLMREHLANVVGNRLRARRWVRDHPATLQVPVDQPLFVVGQPRTGTTLLYRLLAQDPQVRAPRLWEVMAPVPPPVPDGGRDDPRYRRCERDLARLRKYLPELAIAHGVGASEPEECHPLLETSALSPTFFLYLDIPAYWARLMSAPPAEVTAAYGFFRQQVQILLMRAEGRRWVSKAPAHLCFLDGLARAFPDAGIVMTHREPVESIPSLCSLVAIVRSASSDHVDPARVGRAALDAFVEAAARADAGRRNIAASCIVDVPYAHLVQDPTGVVRDLYAHFRLPFTPLFERRMRAWLARHPRHMAGVHRYTPEQFGLDRARIEQATADYRRRYFA